MTAATVTAAPGPRDEEVATPGLWRNADFLRFWFGETVSLLGSQITILALPLTAVYVFDAGPGDLGLLRFVQLAPYLAFGLLFGVWVDRVRRRPVLLGANLARMLLVGSVPVLAVLGELRLTTLLVVALGIGIASVLFDVSWASYLPTVVKDPRRIVEANSKLGVTSTASETVGPGLAGALVSAFTAPIAMAIDAFSYLASVVALATIRTREPRPEKPAARRLLPELREGLRWVFGDRILRSIGFVGGSCNFVLMGMSTLFVLYAVKDQEIGPGLLGLIWSVASVGGLLGALLSDRLVRRVRLGRVYGGSIAAVFLPLLLVPAADGPLPVVVAMFMVAFFVCYLGLSISNVIIMSLRQVVTPGALLGRMTGAMRTLLFGGGALGGPIAGWLGATFGLRSALWIIALLAAGIVVPVLLSPVARLDAMPTGASTGAVALSRRDARGRHRLPGPARTLPWPRSANQIPRDRHG